MSTENQMRATKVVTGKVRFSYLHVFTPKAIDESSEPKYSASILIPKSDEQTLTAIKKAIEAATIQGKEKWGGKVPIGLKSPLRDGDTDPIKAGDETYAGCMFINASSKTKPGLIFKNKMPITNEEELYSGCYGRASINFYPFTMSVNKGIAAGLNNLMKLEDGEPLGGRQSAENDFEGYFDDGDDIF